VCSSLVRGADKLITHLRLFHGIADRGQEVCCGQNNCPRKFTCFYALKIHLLKQHANLIDSTDCTEFDYCISAKTEDIEMSSNCRDDNFSSKSEDIGQIKDQLKMAMLSFACLLSAKPNLTMSNVQNIIQSVRDLLDVIVGFFCVNIQEVCIMQNAVCKTEDISKMLAEWRSIPSCLDSVGTKYKIEKTLGELGLLIPLTEVVLSNHEDRHNVTCTGSSVNFRTDDSMQYIPLGPLLHKLSKHSIASKCNVDLPRYQRDGFIADFRDTQTFISNLVCKKYPDTFLIHLFVDAFETCNELGSHTGVHKLEAMYMCIRNVSAECQAQLDNIFLIALWYAADVKKYGYNRILEPIVKDLKQLESDEGMCIDGDVIHGVLVLVSANNLGAHSLFGFLESFSAKKFCRLCEVVKGDAKHLEADFVLRTPALYNAAVEMLQSTGYNPSETGIKRSCLLNELGTFHVTTNYALDAMHDLLEVIIPYELQNILPVFVRKELVGEAELQSLIVNFNYGPADQNSTLPFTSSANIRVKASEAWCLLRCIPVILGSRIPEGDEHWRVITLLCEIIDIIFAPNTVRAHASISATLLMNIIKHSNSCSLKKIFCQSTTSLFTTLVA
jgi:hypothetical protein